MTGDHVVRKPLIVSGSLAHKADLVLASQKETSKLSFASSLVRAAHVLKLARVLPVLWTPRASRKRGAASRFDLGKGHDDLSDRLLLEMSRQTLIFSHECLRWFGDHALVVSESNVQNVLSLKVMGAA